MEEAVSLEIMTKEEQLVKLFEDKSAKIEEERARSEQKLGEAELKAKSLQSLLDESQNELFEVTSNKQCKASWNLIAGKIATGEIQLGNNRRPGTSYDRP